MAGEAAGIGVASALTVPREVAGFAEASAPKAVRPEEEEEAVAAWERRVALRPMAETLGRGREPPEATVE